MGTPVLGVFFPDEAVSIQPVWSRDGGYLRQPPKVFPIVAARFNADPSISHNGRYHEPTGQLQAHGTPDGKDTFLDGSDDRDGISFTTDAGSDPISDQWYDPVTNTWGMYIGNNADGSHFGITQTTATETIPHSQMYLRRWFSPAPARNTSDNCVTYLHFAYGDENDVRIALRYGKPMIVEALDTDGVTWLPTRQSRWLPTIESYLHGNNNTIHIRLLPQTERGQWLLEFGAGLQVVYTPPDKRPLPTQMRLHLEGTNGAHQFTFQTNQHAGLTLTVPPFETFQKETSDAFVFVNQLSPPDDTLKTEITPIVDTEDPTRIGFSVDAYKGDTYEDITDDPAFLTDVCACIPAVWGPKPEGSTVEEFAFFLKTVSVSMRESLDDITRTRTTSATLIVNNWWGEYVGGYRRVAVNIDSSLNNGEIGYSRSFTGVVDHREIGNQLQRNDPTRLLHIPVHDIGAKLMSPIGFTVLLDGYALSTAVRLLTEIGSIHPLLLDLSDIEPTGIYYPPGAPTIPPGEPGYAPYGPAGEDAPEGIVILPRGTGDNPLLEFDGTWSPWRILLELARDRGLPYVTTDGRLISIPFYFGAAFDGTFAFGVYDPRLLDPVACFDADPAQSGFLTAVDDSLPILPIGDGVLVVENNTSTQRSEITFEGRDGKTFELLLKHFQMPWGVQEDLGWPERWVERNAGWLSEEQLTDAILTAAYQASLASQTALIPSLYHPDLHVGMVVWLFDPATIGPAPALYYITQISSERRAGTDMMPRALYCVRSVDTPA